MLITLLCLAAITLPLSAPGTAPADGGRAQESADERHRLQEAEAERDRLRHELAVARAREETRRQEERVILEKTVAAEVAAVQSAWDEDRRELRAALQRLEEETSAELRKREEASVAREARLHGENMEAVKKSFEQQDQLRATRLELDEERAKRMALESMKIDNAALRLRIRGLTESHASSDAGAAPKAIEWALAYDGETTERRRARRELGMIVEAPTVEAPTQDLLRFLQLASGVELVTTADVRFRPTDDPRQLVLDGLTFAEAFESVIGEDSLTLLGGHVVVGTREELSLLADSPPLGIADPADAAATAARARLQESRAKMPTDMAVADVWEWIRTVHDIDVWRSTDAQMATDYEDVNFEATGKLSAWEFIQLVCAEQFLVGTLVGGVLVLDFGTEDRALRHRPLDPEVEKLVGNKRVTLDLEEAEYSDQIDAVAAEVGLDLALSEDVLLKLDLAGSAPLRLRDVEVSFVLQLLRDGHGLEMGWKRDGSTLVLELR